MKLRHFFSLPIIVLGIAPTLIAVTREPSLPTATTLLTFTPELITGNSILSHKAIVEPTLLIAQKSRTQRMRFEHGTTSAVVESAVVRGTRDIYLLDAKRRQTMTVNITSPEKNAVFDIEPPNGLILRQEATSWRGVLPATGDYKIIVGGTRGNTGYRLRVSVK